MSKVKIIALCGKAGAGKDTILHQIIRTYPNKFNEIVSCTTRPPRDNEREGINYYFLSVDDFTKKILNGDMLEATQFNGWHYGTMLSSLSREKINIGVFNPAGIACLLEDKSIELQIYWIDTTDKIRLIRQLNREDNPDIREIIRRYFTDDEDFCDMEEYDYTKLTNNNPDDIAQCANLIARWAE